MISRRCIVETGKSVGKAKKEKFNLGVQVEIAIRQLDKSEIYIWEFLAFIALTQ